jgi:hypothetical protein
LALGFNRIGYSQEVLLIDQRHGSHARGMAAEGSSLMLSQAAIQAPSRSADVIGAIAAKQDV